MKMFISIPLHELVALISSYFTFQASLMQISLPWGHINQKLTMTGLSRWKTRTSTKVNVVYKRRVLPPSSRSAGHTVNIHTTRCTARAHCTGYDLIPHYLIMNCTHQMEIIINLFDNVCAQRIKTVIDYKSNGLSGTRLILHTVGHHFMQT